MLIIFQIFFVLFALFALFAVIQRKRAGQLDTRGAFFWIFFWCAATVAVLWPNSTQMAARYLGIGRGTDLVLYLSIALMFYLLFRMNVKIEGINRDVTKVVRSKALEEIKKN